MEFEINQNKLFKVVYTRYNPSQIVARLMTGDLYDCLLILQTPDISKYSDFLDYSNRINIEAELDSRVKADKTFARVNIGVHPIYDVNKTERQLSVIFEDDITPTIMGNNSSSILLIGVFIKNEPFGLSHGKSSLTKHRMKLTDIVFDYFTSYFDGGVKIVPLYGEVDEYGY